MADALPPFEPKAMLAFFVRKGLQIGFSWLDVQREEHDRAFTVAKMMQVDLLEDTYSVLKEGFARGDSPAMIARDLRGLMQARGWWGQKVLTDPLTGETKAAQLGSPRRVDVIVRTNMRTAYAAGRHARQQRTRAAFPFLRYVSVMDGREREEHRAWHNIILPANDPWWDTHYGPCDWGCRCKAVALNQRMMTRLGLSVSAKPPSFGTYEWVNKRTGEARTIEKGIGPGWDYHPGKSVAGLGAAPTGTALDEESAAARPESSARFAVLDRAFGLNAANGFSALFRDAGGWPVVVSRAMFDAADALTIRRFARLLATPQEIRWVWLADQAGGVILARRWLLDTIMLEISSAGWRIGRARTDGTVSWSQGNEEAASYDPRQPRDGRGRFSSNGRAAMIESLSGGKAVVKAVPLGIIPDSVAAFLFEKARVDVRGKSLMVDHSLSVKILRDHEEVTVRRLFGAMAILKKSTHAEPGGRKGKTGAPRFRVRASGKKYDTYLVGEVHKRTVKIVTIYQRPLGSVAKR